MPVVPNATATKEKYPFSFHCEKYNCFWITAHKTEQEATQIQDTHDCPRTGGRNYLMEEKDEKGQHYTKPHVGKSIAEKIWDELDQRLEELMTTSPQNQMLRATLQGHCRSLTFSLYLMCQPYYESHDAVTAEAVKRRAIRNGELEWEPTPGYKYNPPPPGTVSLAMARKQTTTPTQKAARPKRTVEPHLDEETISGIKHAVNMGFALDDLAKMYKTTPEHIERVSGS